MKHLVLILFIFLSVQFSVAFGQMTIDSCQAKARSNYPLVRQYGLIEQSESYTLSNAGKGYLPQFSFSARATYQSEVLELPFKIPGFTGLSKDQYQTVAELSQVVWDGGAISAQKDMAKASTELDKQKFEVDMYALKERVNQLFFGILLLNEQIKLNETLQSELENNYKRVAALKQNGVANQADVNAIRVEQLKAKQNKAILMSGVKAYKQMLSAFIGEYIDDSVILEKPNYLSITIGMSEVSFQLNNRPEINMFEAQSNFLESQKKIVFSANMPKIGLFVQGGYGKPGLNMLSNEFSPFYLSGIRLNWNIGNYYTQNNNIEKINLNQKNIELQKEAFMFNTNLKVMQQNNEIEKTQELIKADDEIINLRTEIKNAAQIRLENGTYNTTDLIREINAENMAIQEKALHEIQLLISIYNIKNTTNN